MTSEHPGSHFFNRREPAPPPGGHDIIGTNLLTKFHEDRRINVPLEKNALPPGDHVFYPTGIIFEFVQDIIGMNVVTKFHEDRKINVASRVKNVPPCFSRKRNTNILTKFPEDWIINVASN
ncbi:hypothetical protein DPMN_174175 [Dreissena polymorpha]|uniref:Uncharacterized protein n=1 Tax=Dreissena polymorpha TaxID=45954 RepID=A0A9D4E4X4_DREPO|nr:hypothetical protein DPMN_174175 [Dreissena polymorpha]